jgi:hypothetical protein
MRVLFCTCDYLTGAIQIVKNLNLHLIPRPVRQAFGEGALVLEFPGFSVKAGDLDAAVFLAEPGGDHRAGDALFEGFEDEEMAQVAVADADEAGHSAGGAQGVLVVAETEDGLAGADLMMAAAGDP